MKSILFMAMLIVGLAACETPQPATGTTDDNSNMQNNQSGNTGATGTTSRTDTSTTKKDSLP